MARSLGQWSKELDRELFNLESHCRKEAQRQDDELSISSTRAPEESAPNCSAACSSYASSRNPRRRPGRRAARTERRRKIEVLTELQSRTAITELELELGRMPLSFAGILEETLLEDILEEDYSSAQYDFSDDIHYSRSSRNGSCDSPRNFGRDGESHEYSHGANSADVGVSCILGSSSLGVSGNEL